MKLFKIAAVLLLSFVVYSHSSFAGEPMRNAKITLKAPDGKTYTAVTDASGKFVIRDMESSGSGFSFEVSSSDKTYLCGTTNHFRVVSSSSSSSSGESSSVSTAREKSTGQASGKRTHKPFSTKLTLCPGGDQDCDGAADKCVINVSSDGETIQGMAINEKATPVEKKPKKKANTN